MLCLTIVSEKESFNMCEHNSHSYQDSKPGSYSSKIQEPLFSGQNMVAIYTVLSILVEMKNSLGLEATLEYIDKYLSTVEKHNPQIKHAASLAIKLISVEKIYNEAVHCEKK